MGEKCVFKFKYVEVYSLQNVIKFFEGVIFYEFVCFKGVNDEVYGGFFLMFDVFFMGYCIFDMYKLWVYIVLIFDLFLKIWVYYGNLELEVLYNGLSMVFGDGSVKYFYFLVIYDVFVYEVVYVFIEYYLYLEYENQLGVIDEVYFDFVGEMFEYFIIGIFDFYIGEQLDKLDNEVFCDMCD